jgi:uncharacterized membrane protein YdjX (TVP38/TMEM64 family)
MPSYERGCCTPSDARSSDSPCSDSCVVETDQVPRAPVPALRFFWLARLVCSTLLLSLLIALVWWVANGQAYGTLLALLHLVNGIGLAGAPLLVGVQAVTFLLAMPLWPVELAAGFVYGFWVGVPVACLAYAVGCVPPFLLSRRLLRASASGPTPAAARCPSIVAGMRTWLDRRNIASRISTALEREPFMCVLCLRISPINASGVLSYLLGLTAVPLRAYTAASALGGAPMATVFVYLGTAIDSLAELATGRAPHDARTGLLLACGGAGCFVGMFVAARLAAQRLREAERLISVGDGTHGSSTHGSCDASSAAPEGGAGESLGDRWSETQVVQLPACTTKGPLAWTCAECGESPSAVLTTAYRENTLINGRGSGDAY